MSYNELSNTWTVCSENIVGSVDNDQYSDASLPRIYHLALDFQSGMVEFITDEPVMVNPSESLKLEDIVAVPDTNLGLDPLDKDVWLVSEGNSHLVETNIFLSKDFGPPDLSSFDPNTYSNSRLIRVNARTGIILEEGNLPNYTQWDQDYNWDGK